MEHSYRHLCWPVEIRIQGLANCPILMNIQVCCSWFSSRSQIERSTWRRQPRRFHHLIGQKLRSRLGWQWRFRARHCVRHLKLQCARFFGKRSRRRRGWGLRVAFCLRCLCQSLCLSRFKLFWRGCLPLGRNLWRQNLYWSCTRSIISLLPVWRGCLRLGRNLCSPFLMCCDDIDVVVGRRSVELPGPLAFLAILTATMRNCHAILC